jgi:hypothetical protein
MISLSVIADMFGIVLRVRIDRMLGIRDNDQTVEVIGLKRASIYQLQLTDSQRDVLNWDKSIQHLRDSYCNN